MRSNRDEGDLVGGFMGVLGFVSLRTVLCYSALGSRAITKKKNTLPRPVVKFTFTLIPLLQKVKHLPIFTKIWGACNILKYYRIVVPQSDHSSPQPMVQIHGCILLPLRVNKSI